MKHAFQHAESVSGHDNLIFFFSFFHARENGLEKSTEGMYRSLLSQMMEKIPGLQHVLSTQRTRNVWPAVLLSNLFCEAVHALKGNRLTCYIDALDECDDAEIRDMIEVFEELTEAATAKRIGFRVCFSSRHYPWISMATYQELILEDQEDHEDDINVYIRNKLRVPTRMKANTVAEIQRRASGIFLWVILVVRILKVDGGWGYAHKPKARLKEIPNGLNELFQDIIHRGTQDGIYLIPKVQWIMFSPCAPRDVVP